MAGAILTVRHYLALGDSYTAGETMPEPDRWPVDLARRLRQAGMLIDDPRIVAVTGWTTDELSEGMDEADLLSGYDLVTLQIGVNNHYRGRTASDYQTQLAGLLARTIALADGDAGRVLVVSIPDWGVTPFARDHGRDVEVTAAELNHFNRMARVETAEAGGFFIDITDISRQHPEMIASDGLHPSAGQYQLWVERIFPVAQAALSRAR